MANCCSYQTESLRPKQRSENVEDHQGHILGCATCATVQGLQKISAPQITSTTN